MDRNRVLLQNLGVSDNQNVFLGLNNVEIAQISSYVNMSNVNTRDLSLLETTLTNASYLVNNRLTLADAAVYLGIYENKDLVTELQSEKYSNLKRWFNHVQFLCIPNNNSLQKVNLNFAPTLIPVSFGPSGAAEGKKADNKVEKKATDGKAVANKDGESKEKVKKEEKKVEAKKEEKAADDDEALDPSKLDFRVGLIVKCWLHPEAEKLLCEEIDLGESTGPRTICSGIRAHYNPDDIVGRKVLVLANLKDRTMVHTILNSLTHCILTISSVGWCEVPRDGYMRV